MQPNNYNYGQQQGPPMFMSPFGTNPPSPSVPPTSPTTPLYSAQGPPPTSFGPPPTSFGPPPTSFGQPTTPTSPRQTQFSAPPTSFGQPATPPPTSFGQQSYTTPSTYPPQSQSQTPVPQLFTPGAPPTSFGQPVQPGQPGQPGQPPQPVSYSPLTSISYGASSVSNFGGARYPQPVTPGPGTPQQPAPAPKVSPRSEQKINPNQIPSPTVLDTSIPPPYHTRSANVPPSAIIPFTAIDDGNTSPKFMRMTTYTIGANADVQKNSQLPIGFVLQPLAEVGPGEEGIPLVDFGPSGPIRCIRCKAYINPYVNFTNGGHNYVCRMCDVSNEVPREYFSPLEATGRRNDHQSRPELCKGTVEFVATKEYMERPPKPLSYLFALDVSYSSVTSGLLQLMVDSIKRILTVWPQDPTIKIGFVTYDTTVHFYNLNSALQQPQMLVVPDVEAMFLPIAEEVVFVSYQNSKSIVDALLDKLPAMFANTKVSDTVLGAVIQAGHLAMNSNGGKLLIFQSSLPSAGPGKLVKRDDTKLIGTDKEKTLYTPHETFYTGIVSNLVKSHVGVDIFACATSGFVDIATLATVTQGTGGQLYYYPNFNAQKDGEKLYLELYRNLSRTTGSEGLLRVRTGRGLTVTKHFGNFLSSNGMELDFATLDSDKSIYVELKHEDKLDEKSEAYIQVALLYTTSSGQRRIRVFNMALPVSSVLGNMFRSADLDTIANGLTRSVLHDVYYTNLSQLRATTIDRTVEMLYCYRKFCATQSSPGQLILPESLKLLPIYILAANKNALMRHGTDVTPDERSYLLALLSHLPPSLSTPLFYPRMYALHNLSPEYGVPDADGRVKLPPLARPTSENLMADNAYLVEDGQKIFVWLGKNLPTMFLTDLFIMETYNTPYITLVPTNPDHPEHLASRVHTIIKTIRATRACHQQVHFVKQGEPSEAKFFSYLVEDKALETMNYVDFLCHVHRQIQLKLQ